MRVLLPIGLFVLMSACTIAEQVAQDTVRQEAKQIVNGLVTQNFPGVNAAPLTDCIVDNATTAEILTIGGAALNGPTPQTTQLVLAIAQRPETVSCLVGNGSGLFAI